MISRSILFNGPPAAEHRLYTALNVRAQDVLGWSEECAFLPARRNGALVSETAGDFSRAIDLFLFDLDDEGLRQRLASLASGEIRVAMPNEEDEDPSSFLLWEDGRLSKVSIHEIDDRFIISRPPRSTSA